MKRLVSLSLALVMALALCVPALAVDPGIDVESTGNFWQNIASKSPDFIRGVIGECTYGVCSVSSDGKHHGQLTTGEPTKNGQYECLCNDCGEHFFLTEGQVQQAIKDNQQPGIDSSGFYRIHCLPEPVTVEGAKIVDKYFISFFSTGTRNSLSWRFSCTAPYDVTGYYLPMINGTKYRRIEDKKWYYTSPNRTESILSKGQSETIGVEVSHNAENGSYVANYALSLDFLYKPARVIPSVPRPGNIPGGQFVFDEQNNVLVLPDKKVDVKEWTFDYQSMTYHITTTDNSTYDVTYGDKTVNVINGDVNITINYPGSDKPKPEPNPDCQHEYTDTVTTPATCTSTGVRTFTCSKCGHTYTESIPALGHTWTVKENKPTEYGPDGQLVTQGYTIYKCDVCGEEYKDDKGVGPPAPNEEVTHEGFLSWIWGILKALFGSVAKGIIAIFDFFFSGDSGLEFYYHPSTFSGVSVWD